MAVAFSACEPAAELQTPKAEAKGALFIIGGGELTPDLMADMVRLAGVDSAGQVLILPMSSIEPDSSYLYMLEKIGGLCVNKPQMLMVDSTTTHDPSIAGRLASASLIYLSGGDQNRFMQRIKGSVVADEIRKAYFNGAMIAGTSAGAALMSKIMITGDQKKVPEYESTYSLLRTDNAIYSEGLGLLDSVIVDQHFIVRSRYNRLFTALHDHPGLKGMGVDESTAAYVKGGEIKVYGESQVILVESAGAVAQRDGKIIFDQMIVKSLVEE
jgi:cyanophycinase